jgi:glycosyltransferase involved in cell wall biosynthesis
MTVGIYTSTPLEAQGGGERFAIRLANYLQSMGVDSILVSPINEVDERRVPADQIARDLRAQHRVERYETSKARVLGRFVNQPLPSLDSLLANSANLIFVYRIPSASFLRVVRESGVRIALLLHGVTLEHLPHPNPFVFAYQAYLRVQLARLAPLVNDAEIHIQVFTETMATGLVDRGIRRSLIHVIPLSIDPWMYGCNRNDVVFDVLFLGRLEELHKGVTRLGLVARRLAKLRYADLTISVAGSGSAAPIMQRLTTTCPNLRVLGYVDETEKQRLLSSAGLLLLTSNIETYPTVVLEALASGLPVISTPVSGPVHILRKSPDFGVVTSFDPETIVFSILNYYQKWKSNKQRYFDERLRRRETATHGLTQTDPYGPYLDLVRW